MQNNRSVILPLRLRHNMHFGPP